MRIRNYTCCKVKTSFLVIGLFLFMAIRCIDPHKGQEKSVNPTSSIKTDTLAVASMREKIEVSFAEDIQPIFETRCQPCHFPGGKMYARLPFDDPKTILEIGEGFFSRIKDEQEQQVLLAFLEQQTH